MKPLLQSVRMALGASPVGLMREHQIVINLKREQFEEVQRLARLAGSKSVSTYLRDRVISLLGLEQGEMGSSLNEPPSAKELLEINQELARMHRELQVFIAESLSQSVYFEQPEEREVEVDQVFSAYQELQKTIEDHESDDTTGSSTPKKARLRYQPSAAPADSAESVVSDPYGAGAVNIPDAIEASNWSSHPSSGIAQNTGVYTSVTADSIWLTPTGAPQAPQQSDTASSASIEQNKFQNPDDDLEDLAERAFAISPRLGKLDAPQTATPQGFRKRQSDDPLQDLIDDSIIEQAQQQRRANAQFEQQESPQKEVIYAFEEGETEITDIESTDEPVTAPTSEQMDEAIADEGFRQPEEDETAAQEEEEEVKPSTAAPPLPGTAAMPGPPPKKRVPPSDNSESEGLSGGPPPKRRKK